MSAQATKAQWQESSLLDLTAGTEAAFMGIVADVPTGALFTVNDIRHRLDAADVPARARGGLFHRACARGLIRAVDITVYGQRFPRTRPSTGKSAHYAQVRLYRRTGASP